MSLGGRLRAVHRCREPNHTTNNGGVVAALAKAHSWIMARRIFLAL